MITTFVSPPVWIYHSVEAPESNFSVLQCFWPVAASVSAGTEWPNPGHTGHTCDLGIPSSAALAEAATLQCTPVAWHTAYLIAAAATATMAAAHTAHLRYVSKG